MAPPSKVASLALSSPRRSTMAVSPFSASIAAFSARRVAAWWSIAALRRFISRAIYAFSGMLARSSLAMAWRMVGFNSSKSCTPRCPLHRNMWYPKAVAKGAETAPSGVAKAALSNSATITPCLNHPRFPPRDAEPGFCECLRAISAKSAPALITAYIESARALALAVASGDLSRFIISMWSALTSPAAGVRFSTKTMW